MDIEIASARQLSALQQQVYDLQIVDAVYQKVTDHLLGLITPLWQARFTLPANGWITEEQIRETRIGYGRFWPSERYGFNDTDWHELQPFPVPILLGYNVADGASTEGLTPDPEIAEIGQVLYQWINTRLHMSEGTLMQLASYGKAVQLQQDAAGINSLVKSAFGDSP